MSTFKGRAAMFALWVLPEFILEHMPPSFNEAVEREVYDGMTRHEWFVARVKELQAPDRRSGDTKGVTK